MTGLLHRLKHGMVIKNTKCFSLLIQPVVETFLLKVAFLPPNAAAATLLGCDQRHHIGILKVYSLEVPALHGEQKH